MDYLNLIISGTIGIIGALLGAFFSYRLNERVRIRISNEERNLSWDKLLHEVEENLEYVKTIQSKFREDNRPPQSLYDNFVTDTVGAGFSVFKRSNYDTVHSLSDDVREALSSFYSQLTVLEQRGRQYMVQIPGPAQLVIPPDASGQQGFPPSLPGMPSPEDFRRVVEESIPIIRDLTNDTVISGQRALDNLKQFEKTNQLNP